MKQAKSLKLFKFSDINSFYGDSSIQTPNGRVPVAFDSFIAIGFEKSQTKRDWDDSDYFKVLVLVKGVDELYYLLKIEHKASVFSPAYVESDFLVEWVEIKRRSEDWKMIGELYSMTRGEYTLTIKDRTFFFPGPPYTIHQFDVNYSGCNEIVVYCRFLSPHPGEGSRMLEYLMSIDPLIRSNLFYPNPFRAWDGEVIEENFIVWLNE